MPPAKHRQSLMNAERAFLALEARRMRYAFEYDPILGMSVSKVDPLPHQIEAVYKHVLKKSRIRYMLAHDPGAGKTVMAGLVMKEIELREGRKKRVLVVVPGQLKEQWRWELQDKFDDRFEIIDRAYFEANGRDAVWEGDHLVTSIDFAKRADIAASLRRTRRFDIVVVDEAHKMSAYSSGRSTTKTRRYRLGEILSANTEHLLFLTATPHKGDAENFQLLLDLLEPGYLAGEGMIEASIREQDNPLFLRRAKEDMRDFEGRPLFMPRSVETPDIRMSAKERALYTAMSKYVKEQYNLALQSSKGHNVTFALLILQRRFASSPFALLKSLKRRKGRLEELKKSTGKVRGRTAVAAAAAVAAGGSPLASVEKADEMSEAERWEEESKWELLSTAQTKEDLQTEIDTVSGLVEKAQKVLDAGTETKLRQLRETIRGLDKRSPGEKILIFTESRDTLDYLVSNIDAWGYAVNTIHGSMSAGERRRAESVFRDETQIMVATEAAGEGINLQFCHLMVNYDLPWNPNRLEQRMGRIHRYGQLHPVSVFNLVAADTREGEIMNLLFAKLEAIKAAMGSDKIFDVISEIVPGKSLSQMLLDATVRARRQNQIKSELADALSLKNREVMRYMEDGLASRFIDYSSLNEVDESREGRLAPEYTRDLFERIMTAGRGLVKWSRRRGAEGIASVRMPADLADAEDVRGEYASAAFDKKIRMANPGTELLTFGHPAFDAALRWAEEQYSDAAMSGAMFTDVSGRLDGHVVFAEGAITDGLGAQTAKRLFACYVDRNGSASQVSPSVIRDLVIGAPGGGAPAADGAIMEASEAAVSKMLEKFAAGIAAERDKEAKLDKKYGLESVDQLIGSINRDIMQLLDKKRRGKKTDLAIYNKRQERQRYRQSRKSLRERVRAKTALSRGRAEIVGVAEVVPESGAATARSKAALEAARRFERAAGRDHTVAAGQGLGFDLRSSENDSSSAGAQDGKAMATGRRMYIQAKGATEDGAIVLTPNEWFRAKMLGGDCFLYVTADAGDGQILRVQDPAGVLDARRAGPLYEVSMGQIREAASSSQRAAEP